MQVKIDLKGDILIVAETDFEAYFIQNFGERKYESFLKRGVNVDDVIGLKLNIDTEQVNKGGENG